MSELRRYIPKFFIEGPTVIVNPVYLRERIAKFKGARGMSEFKCDMRTKLVGDGCSKCNHELYIDLLSNELDELKAENERKDAQIREAIAILRDGSDYEKSHVPAILFNALKEQGE